VKPKKTLSDGIQEARQITEFRPLDAASSIASPPPVFGPAQNCLFPLQCKQFAIRRVSEDPAAGSRNRMVIKLQIKKSKVKSLSKNSQESRRASIQ
jgi:hypothetical protein